MNSKYLIENWDNINEGFFDSLRNKFKGSVNNNPENNFVSDNDIRTPIDVTNLQKPHDGTNFRTIMKSIIAYYLYSNPYYKYLVSDDVFTYDECFDTVETNIEGLMYKPENSKETDDEWYTKERARVSLMIENDIYIQAKSLRSYLRDEFEKTNQTEEVFNIIKNSEKELPKGKYTAEQIAETLTKLFRILPNFDKTKLTF